LRVLRLFVAISLLSDRERGRSARALLPELFDGIGCTCLSRLG
jgi:hypothetical protein